MRCGELVLQLPVGTGLQMLEPGPLRAVTGSEPGVTDSSHIIPLSLVSDLAPYRADRTGRSWLWGSPVWQVQPHPLTLPSWGLRRGRCWSRDPGRERVEAQRRGGAGLVFNDRCRCFEDFCSHGQNHAPSQEQSTQALLGGNARKLPT